MHHLALDLGQLRLDKPPDRLFRHSEVVPLLEPGCQLVQGARAISDVGKRLLPQRPQLWRRGRQCRLRGAQRLRERSQAAFRGCRLLVVPLLLILTRVTRFALIEGATSDALNDLTALVGYCGVTITAGILLFDYIWDE